MILFLKDWNRYPKAIVHTSTRNKSFLELADIYAAMGVKNNDFHLSLINPALEHVDPFDPNLDEATIDAVVEEVMMNPWYYYREICRIVPQGSMESIPLRANRGVIALAWCFLNHIDIFLIQPRQTGKSVGADSTSNYVVNIAGRGTRISLLTKDDELRVANVERLKKMRDAMPPYLNPFKKGVDLDNQNVITAEIYGNKLATSVGRSSETQALNVGRGITSPIVDGDEFPFIPHISTIFPAMLSSTNAARKTAREAGGFYGNYFTTTAGRKNSPSGGYIYDMVHGGMAFSERLFDCESSKHAQDVVYLNRRDMKAKPLVNATFNHRQLGISDREHYENLLNSSARGEIADMDYFNVWASGGKESPLDPELLALINKSIKDPVYSELNNRNYLLRWHVPKSEVDEGLVDRRMVMGLDLSDGIGRDSIAMVLIDADTLETVMTANVVQTNLYLFGEFVGEFLVKYKNVVLIPERKQGGQALIDSLLIYLPTKGEDPFKRIYSTLVEDREYEQKPQYRPIVNGVGRTQSFYDYCKRHFGYATTGTGRHSRGNLYNNTFVNACKMANVRILDQMLIDEISALETKNGRLDHSDGGHDDMVIAWMMACWMLMSTQNLSFYGLNGCLTQIDVYDDTAMKKERSAYDDYMDAMQKKLRQQIFGLIEEIAATDDDMVVLSIKNRLAGIEKQLTEDIEPSRTLDNMIEEALAKRSDRLGVALKPAVSYNDPVPGFYQSSSFGYRRR